MRALKLVALAVLVGAGGCLFGEVRDIPCDSDAACPAGYFCDLPRAECREQTDAVGPPVLRLDRIRDTAGDEVRTPLIPPETPALLGLFVENTGGTPAEGVALHFGVLDCFAFDVHESTLPDAVAPGATVEIDVTLTPDPGCEGLTIIDWFLTYSGRETRGAFDVNVRN